MRLGGSLALPIRLALPVFSPFPFREGIFERVQIGY